MFFNLDYIFRIFRNKFKYEGNCNALMSNNKNINKICRCYYLLYFISDSGSSQESLVELILKTLKKEWFIK